MKVKEGNIKLVGGKNKAVKCFIGSDSSGEDQRDFEGWYHLDTVLCLTNLSERRGFLRYSFFDSGGDIEKFKDQFMQLRSLNESLARELSQKHSGCCFISKPGAGEAHYIFGVLVRYPDGIHKLLVINPIGETEQHDLYTILMELKEKIGLEIFISSTVIQRQDIEKKLSSCGPMCVELMNHISALPIEQIAIILDANESSQVIEKHKLSYKTVDITQSALIPMKLKNLLGKNKEEYITEMVELRKHHLSLLSNHARVATKSTEAQNRFFEIVCENSEEQVLVNKLCLDEIQLQSLKSEGEFIKLKNSLVKQPSSYKTAKQGLPDTRSDALLAWHLQENEKQGSVDYNFEDGKQKTLRVEQKSSRDKNANDNAFNRYDNFAYWYQDLDISKIGTEISKGFKDQAEFMDVLGAADGEAGIDTLRSAKIELEKKAKKLVGIYNTGSHWIAFAIFKGKNTKVVCLYKDSLNKDRKNFESNISKAFGSIDIKRIGKRAEQIGVFDNEMSFQNGLVSCGIFALKNMELLAKCIAEEDYERIEFYNPGRDKGTYKVMILLERKELGIIYAKSIYRQLEVKVAESKLRKEDLLKDFIGQLKLGTAQINDRILMELAKKISVDQHLLKKEIENHVLTYEVKCKPSSYAVNISKPAVSGNANITPKSSSKLKPDMSGKPANANDDSKRDKEGETLLDASYIKEEKPQRYVRDVKVKKNKPKLEIVQPSQQAVEQESIIVGLLEGAKNSEPEDIIQELSNIHYYQANTPNPSKKLIEELNELYITCISKSYDIKLIKKLLEERLGFLQDQIERDKILRALENIPKGKTNSERAENEKVKATLKFKYSEKGSELYIAGLSGYAKASIESEDYQQAAWCYDLLRQNTQGEACEVARKSFYSLEAKVILDVPTSTANLVYNNIERYIKERHTDSKSTLDELGAREVFLQCQQYFKSNEKSTLDKLELAGDLFLQCQQYVKARKIYNTEITIVRGLLDQCKKEHEVLTVLLNRLGRKLGMTSLKSSSWRIEDLVTIDSIRDEFKKERRVVKSLIENGMLLEAQKNWNNKFQELLKKIVLQAQEQLGSKATQEKYCVLAIGSLARKEIGLYSDIDLMIVAENKIIKKHEPYFKALISLIELKIIDLGEMSTLPEEFRKAEECRKVEDRMKEPTMKAHYDIAGFFPKVGNKSQCIGTVEEILIGTLKDKKLSDDEQYQAAIQDVLLLNSGDDEKALLIHYHDKLIERNKLISYRIKDLLKGLQYFKYQENAYGRVDIKQTILRYPVLLINRLFAYYGLKLEETNEKQTVTEQKIDALVAENKRRGIDLEKFKGWEDFLLFCFSEARSIELKKWIKFGLKLRMEAQNFYGESEKDEVYLNESLAQERGCVISDEAVREFKELHEEVMRPLYRQVELWVRMIEVNKEKQEVTIKSAAELSKILREEADFLLKKYQETRDMKYASQANWYYEKAVGLDLEGSEKAWVESIKKICDNNRKEGYSLDFFDSKGQTLAKEIEEQYNNKANHEIEGRRNVIRVYKDGCYFHIKELPEAVGIEYAVSSLSHLLFGYTTTPFSTLGSLKKSDGEVIPVLISRTVIGMRLRCDKKDALEEIDDESYGLSVIRTLLTNPDDDQDGNYIVQPTISPAKEIRQRLICVDNDHGFLEKGSEKSGWMWGSKEKCILKSILYCTARMQREDFSDEVKRKVLEINPEILTNWLKKIKKADDNNRKLFNDEPKELKKEYKIVKHNKGESLDVTIPILFQEDTAVKLCYKLLQIHDIFGDGMRRGIKDSYLKILMKLDITVAKHYIAQFAEISKNTPSQVFKKLSADDYEEREVIIKGGGDNGEEVEEQVVIYTLSKTRYLASQLRNIEGKDLIEKRECTPAQALAKLEEMLAFVKGVPKTQEEMISTEAVRELLPLKVRQMVINGRESSGEGTSVNSIFKLIANRCKGDDENKQKQRGVLNSIKGKTRFTKFTYQFERLNLSNCVVLEDEDLSDTLSTQTVWLDITGCSQLTSEGLEIIAKICSQLESLYLSWDILKQGDLSDVQFGSLKKLSITGWVEPNTNFKKLLKCCPNLEQFYVDSNLIHTAYQNVLMLAAGNGQEELIKFLLSKGINIHSIDENDRTALHFAVLGKQESMLRFLLKRGINLECVDKDQKTPVMYAVENGFDLIAKDLVDTALYGEPDDLPRVAKSSKDDKVLDNITKNIKRVMQGDPEMKRINAIDNKGRTVFMYACINNRLDIVDIIVNNLNARRAIEPRDSEGKDALMHAAIHNNKIVLMKLMIMGKECKANLMIQDKTGMTALMHAVDNGNFMIVNLLLTEFSNIDYVDATNDLGMTALSIALEKNEWLITGTLQNAGAGSKVHPLAYKVLLWRYYAYDCFTKGDEIDKAIEFQELAIHHTGLVQHVGLSSDLHNFGCMLHTKALIMADKGNMEEFNNYKKQAYDAFEKAVECHDLNSGSLTEYAQFLIKHYCGDIREYKKIISLLEKAIEMDDDSFLGFGQTEKCTITWALYRFLKDESNKIAIRSSIFACYLLSTFHLNHDDIESSIKYLETLRNKCLVIEDDSKWDPDVDKRLSCEAVQYLLKEAEEGLAPFLHSEDHELKNHSSKPYLDTDSDSVEEFVSKQDKASSSLPLELLLDEGNKSMQNDLLNHISTNNTVTNMIATTNLSTSLATENSSMNAQNITGLNEIVQNVRMSTVERKTNPTVATNAYL